MVQQTVAAAGNTEVPAYVTLIKLGYEVERINESGEELWTATKETLRLAANSPLELLGLSLMLSERGPKWQAKDEEIDAFLAQFELLE